MAKRISCLCILLLFVFGISSTCQAKSVFAIASHGGSEVKAYSIDQDSSITYQATVEETESFGFGAGALCVWPSMDKMFITYEQNDGVIAWASTRNLSRDPETDKFNPGIGELAGMLVDDNNSLLYALKRGSNELYAFKYDQVDNTLATEPLGTQNDYVELAGITTGGYDIALDEDGSEVMSIPVGRLYVSDYLSTKVRFYNTLTWDYEGYIDLDHPAIGIGLDQTREYLYAGFFTGMSGQNYLMRYTIGGDPNDSETCITRDMGAPVMDIAVDEDTGFIYLTLKRSTTNNRAGVVEVYDPANWVEADPNSLVFCDQETDDDFMTDGPAGIAIGPSYKPENGMTIEKADDATEGVIPGDYYNYDITFLPGPSDKSNVVITDKLPEGVDFVSADPVGEYLEWPDHKYVWELGNVAACSSDPNMCTSYFTLTVQVNDSVEPMMELYNVIQAESDVSYVKNYDLTPLGCWGGDIIYVDASKPAGGTGISWTDAYNDLQDAITRATLGCGTEIWIANGTYSPGNSSGDSFVLPDGVSVYGGFAGDETLWEERDWIAYKTVLNGGLVNTKVVTMKEGAVLDGCIVENAIYDGIYGEDVGFTIANCVIENNEQYGIRAFQGDPAIYYCTIRDNGIDGVYTIGAGDTVRIENCKIYNNNENGINCFNSTPTVLNSEVYYNNYYGIRCIFSTYSPTIRNCTIVDNIKKGIYCSGNGAHYADIRNSIVRSNNDNDDQFGGKCSIHNSCFNDPNNPTGSSTPDINDNITCEPDFAYPETFGNYHLASDSVCIDKGDSSVVDPNGVGEYDIDGQARIYTTVVDIGADEVTECSEVSHWMDDDGNGIINYVEFAAFGNSWGMTSSSPNWSATHSKYDFVANSAIDIDDLIYLAEYIWCWSACWLEGNGSVYDKWLTPIAAAQQSSSMMMPMGVETESLAVETQPIERLNSEEIIDFFESLLDDSEVLKLIDEKDLKKFIKSLESDLSVDLP